MAYYLDLSKYEIKWLPNNFTPFHVGWLDDSHTYPTGFTDQVLIDKLWNFCLNPMMKYRGFHLCEFCPHSQLPVLARRGKEQLQLGSTEVLVLGKKDAIYVVPDLLYHYMVEHNYLPPQEFLDALQDSPAPEAPEYQTIRNFYIQEIRRLREGLGKRTSPDANQIIVK